VVFGYEETWRTHESQEIHEEQIIAVLREAEVVLGSLILA
jgi:hypothetical protein